MFSVTDTIVAIATPPGRGGIGVVRLSGPLAHEIALGLLNRVRPLEPRHATFGRVVEPAGEGTRERFVDQVVATRFVSPESFTGEDVVELSGHGSPVLLQRIVEMATGAGARLAEPGEFTFRAYLNGRIDLIQAEAVADLVDAVTPLQARAAMDQLEGTLTTAIRLIDAALFDLIARLEASLDFPDEGFHFITRDGALIELGRVRGDLDALVQSGRTGRLIREGTLVAIVGRPNVGKSSLFNALVGSRRAIVTDVPGTTRDMLTERVDIGGLAVTLVDTAGLRATADAIEVEGVERARAAQRVAALTLFVVDSSAPLTEEDWRIAAALEGRYIVVMSKSDLSPAWRRSELGAGADTAIEVSAMSGAGLDGLRGHIIRDLTGADVLRDTPAISNTRHLGHLDDAIEIIVRVEAAMNAGATEELILAELGGARRVLEEITGRRAPDDLLHHIFGRFCIGK